MKPIIQVVRIEHPEDGLGIFRSINHLQPYNHSQYEKIRNKHNNMKTYPTFQDDVELSGKISFKNVQNYRFAFHTLSQLKKAFTKSQLKECIEELGFRVYLISTKNYYKSSFQVVYRKYISKEDISSLFI